LPTAQDEAQNQRMKVSSLEAIFRALNKAEGRYLVVGGLAVIAHGYVRLTQDLDLVLDLESTSLTRSLEALASLGYRPRVPVALTDFGNSELRKDWFENRNMKVFNLVSDLFPDVVIDIFVNEPFSFEAEYAVSVWKEVASEVGAYIVSVPALIKLKLEADRERDRTDIEKLRQLHPGI